MYFTNESNVMRKKKNVEQEFVFTDVLKLDPGSDSSKTLAVVRNKDGSRNLLSFEACKSLFGNENTTLKQKEVYMQLHTGSQDFFVCEYTCASPKEGTAEATLFGCRSLDGTLHMDDAEGNAVAARLASEVRTSFNSVGKSFQEALLEDLNLMVSQMWMDFSLDDKGKAWLLSISPVVREATEDPDEAATQPKPLTPAERRSAAKKPGSAMGGARGAAGSAAAAGAGVGDGSAPGTPAVMEGAIEDGGAAASVGAPPRSGNAERSYFGNAPKSAIPAERIQAKKQTRALSYSEIMTQMSTAKMELPFKMPSTICYDSQTRKFSLYFVEPSSSIMRKKKKVDTAYIIDKVLNIASVTAEDEAKSSAPCAIMWQKDGEKRVLSALEAKRMLEESDGAALKQKDLALQQFVGSPNYFVCECSCRSAGSADWADMTFGVRDAGGPVTMFKTEEEAGAAVPAIHQDTVKDLTGKLVSGLFASMNLPVERIGVEFVVERNKRVWLTSMSANINIEFFVKAASREGQTSR